MARNSGNKGKIFMVGGIVAAAAVVVFLNNYPPKPQDAAGTVGAAQRHYETQITGSDVTVSPDAVATWIQSDTFDRIAKDPTARALFASEASSRRSRMTRSVRCSRARPFAWSSQTTP